MAKRINTDRARREFSSLGLPKGAPSKGELESMERAREAKEIVNNMFQVTIETCTPCGERPVCTSKGQFKCTCECHN